MSEIENKAGKLKSIFFNKYVITVFIFAVVIVFFDDYNLISYFKTSKKIKDLDEQIEYYQKEIKSNKQKISELKAGGKNIEKIARQKYLFKKDNEDIFIIQEKEK
ncbi:MAG: septum formation initiator family protein [Paludibacter sp.]|nr:septum formation initiator family protein [Paludibacter sp.]